MANPKINSKDKDLKKISVDKTTLEIVLLFYKYELEKKDIIEVYNSTITERTI